MNKLFCLVAVCALLAPFAFAAAPADPQPLDQVEAKFVCMVNDQVFPKEQIPVEVAGKTYYGCCAMCKDRLAQDQAARTAVDPISKNNVDKATAYILIKDADLNVLYFENEANAKAYIAQQKKA